MSDTFRAISDIQSKWDILGDLDRARDVRAIHQGCTNLRELAKALKRSPSLLRHLIAFQQYLSRVAGDAAIRMEPDRG